MLDKAVFDAALLYTTDRTAFLRRYSKNHLARGLLNEIFLESESRPDLAERVAIYALGHSPSVVKKGYDGWTRHGRPVEAKVRNFVSVDGAFPSSQTSTTINDVSRSIVDRYKQDNPLFIFPYFYDGHLSTIFAVDYKHLDQYYEKCLANPKKGRISFKLGASSWLPHARRVFSHQDQSILNYLPRCLR